MSDAVIYYIRRNGLIKIGWTRDLNRRMRELRPDDLLAVEPGNRLLEAGRHRQFAAQHLDVPDGVEWFAPEPELLDHIQRMTTIYAVPELAELRPPPRPRIVVRAPCPTGDARDALIRCVQRESQDTSAMPLPDLAAGVMDSELVTKHAPLWTGLLAAELRRRNVSWSRLVELTGVPQTTLVRRMQDAEDD